MSARLLPICSAAFIVGCFVALVIKQAEVSSAATSWAMVISFAAGVGATLCACIALISEPRRVEEKHTP